MNEQEKQQAQLNQPEQPIEEENGKEENRKSSVALTIRAIVTLAMLIVMVYLVFKAFFVIGVLPFSESGKLLCKAEQNASSGSIKEMEASLIKAEIAIKEEGKDMEKFNSKAAAIRLKGYTESAKNYLDYALEHATAGDNGMVEEYLKRYNEACKKGSLTQDQKMLQLINKVLSENKSEKKEE